MLWPGTGNNPWVGCVMVSPEGELLGRGHTLGREKITPRSPPRDTRTPALLSDYALSVQACGRSPAPVVLTFSPCGSVRTLEFIDLCESVFIDVRDYAREKHLPIGINVGSVSIRKSEVEASVELFRRLSSRLGQ